MFLLVVLLSALSAAAYIFREPLMGYISSFKYKHVENLDSTITNFVGDYKKNDGDDDSARRSVYTKTTETFYNLITDFYEFGWGESFHFAPKWESETFSEGCKRYEHWIAHRIGAKKGMKVLDVGCGVGGPMREIWRASQASITGVNITREHIDRAQRFNKRDGVVDCDFIRADFNDIPVPDNTFDAAYDCEAILHSTDRKRTFTEVYRVLKPGATMVTLQYCTLPAYDDNNAEHREIIRRIDNSNGCYVYGNTVESTAKAISEAGFEILDTFDSYTQHGNVPFHAVFISKTGGQFFGTALGRRITTSVLTFLEAIKIVPRGTVEVQSMLVEAADSFTLGGEKKLLTPGQVFVIRKPL